MSKFDSNGKKKIVIGTRALFADNGIFTAENDEQELTLKKLGFKQLDESEHDEKDNEEENELDENKERYHKLLGGKWL